MNISSRKIESGCGEITLWTLGDPDGPRVELSSLGAGITGVWVPDREGRLENVALSYADPADYMADGPCLGKCPGRYANRIAAGHLVVDGKIYQLAVNNGPNHLHGGPEGFQNRIWESREVDGGVEFSYLSKDGEENYPGTLRVSATYRWNPGKLELSLEFRAETDADTVVNLTNHAYWNLDGADSGSALAHEMRMKTSKWLPTDATLIPIGEVADVAYTPMDFREWKALGKDIHDDFDALRFGKGYDNCWVIDGWRRGLLCEDAVELRSPKSGRHLSVSSDQPGMQVYTGNWLAGSPLNRSGRSYEDYEGVAIEMQGFPDAPNEPDFPSQLIKPGEEYKRTIIYRFSAE